MTTRRVLTNEQLTALPGKTWNRFCDATEFIERQRAKFPEGFGGGSSSARSLTFEAKNNTGATLDRYHVAGIGKCLLSPASDVSASDATPIMELIALTEAHVAKFVVVQEGAGVAETNVTSVYQGLTWCKVDVKTGGDTTCGIIVGDKTKLESGRSGARILWAEKQDDVTKTGVQWCVVDVAGGRATGEIAMGWLITADLPPAKFDRTNSEYTPGTAGTARIVPLKIADPAAATIKYVPEVSGASPLELAALNLTQGRIYATVVPQRLVYGFRSTVNGVEKFSVIGSLRNSVIHANALSAVSTGTGSFTANAITIESGAGPTNADGTAASTVTVQNDFNFKIDAGARLRAEQNDAGVWVCTQAKCPVA